MQPKTGKNAKRALALATAILLGAAPDAASGKALLVLQCGSDWCASGDFVRKVFESAEFRRALAGRYDFAIYDDMEEPGAKVKAANAKLEKVRVPTWRYPAITCLTDEPRRLYAQLENIPYDITADSLARDILAAAEVRREVQTLFDHGRGKNAAAADALGKGFLALEAQTGEFASKFLYEGDFAWKEQWEHLAEIDAGDKFGWYRRLSMGCGFDEIEAATQFAKSGSLENGEKHIAKLRAIPTNNLAVVQRQAIEMAEFAFRREGGSASAGDACTEILRRVLALGRDTVWGQCALGYLRLGGEKIASAPRYRADVRERPASAKKIQTPFKLAEISSRIAALKPVNGYSDEEKRNIALYAVLRRIGAHAWEQLKARPGSRAFLAAFFRDREWMEDFAWSGDCRDWGNAILALESLYFQDGGQWLDGEDGAGRRFATATALEKPDASEEWLADWLDAYRATALSNRLHKAAYTQGTWLWRYAIRQIHCPPEEDPPNQQRFLDTFCNVSRGRMGGALGFVPYRMRNCLGEHIHTPAYYEPWIAAGEWPKRRYSYLVGGVCGELSTFASCCSNAHGLPSIPVGQPRHCAFTRRLADGTWEIDNFISPPTGFSGFWPGSGHWTYTAAAEATFEGDREKRLNADRALELAHLAESRGEEMRAMRLHRLACNSWHGHYTAWRAYGDWIVRAHRPLEEHRIFARACIKALDGLRHPLWDLLTPYFERLAGEGSAKDLADALAEFAPLLRQRDEMLQDNGDISIVLKRWARPLESNPEEMERAVQSIVAAQYGTKTYFAQTLGWCAQFIFADEKRASRFLNSIPKMAAKFADSLRKTGSVGAKAVAAAKRGKPDLGAFILSAEDGGNIAAFRQFAEMQEKIGEPVAGPRFKEKDFNGELVSAEGMICLSKSAPGDNPALHPKAIDSSPVQNFTFCVDQYVEPWAKVVLAGPCSLRGIVVVNRSPDKKLREGQLPIEIEVSEDGANWTKVYEDSRLRDQYRVEFTLSKAPRARYVRVRRLPRKSRDGRDEQSGFMLSKILVYGKKLY